MVLPQATKSLLDINQAPDQVYKSKLASPEPKKAVPARLSQFVGITPELLNAADVAAQGKRLSMFSLQDQQRMLERLKNGSDAARMRFSISGEDAAIAELQRAVGKAPQPLAANKSAMKTGHKSAFKSSAGADGPPERDDDNMNGSDSDICSP